ncbi:MAG: hypothetical protein AB7S26_03400 [Sandaracinaceae bacterium]
MPNAFDDAMREEPVPEGPFRTAERTLEQKKARAREASLDRVARETALAIQRERQRAAGRRRAIWLGLAVCLALSTAVVVLALLFGRSWIALSCPAVAFAISAGFIALRITATRRPPDDPSA